MAVTSRMDFILRITDFIGGHWEDPDWGTNHFNQIILMTAINELASKISDTQVRSQIQNSVMRSVSQTAQNIQQESSQSETS